jgi:hypothetical protein
MFVKEVLAEPFISKNIYLTPSLVGKPGHKGGNFKFERLLIDVRARLLGDTSSFCTTFFDFYGLPEDFPGKEEAKLEKNITSKSLCLLNALTFELERQLGADALRRFIPYIQMYEFEGLLFSDPEKLAAGISQPNLGSALKSVRNKFDTPEEINNGPATAPAKRIAKLYPPYDKPIHGSLAAIEIGLAVIRSECRQFDAWLKCIEALATVAD